MSLSAPEKYSMASQKFDVDVEVLDGTVDVEALDGTSVDV